MRCMICKRLFNRRISFSNFYKIENELICDDCFKRYKLHIGYSFMPIGKGLHIYYLFQDKYHISDNAFLIEYSRIFTYLLDKNQDTPIICYNNFYPNERTLKCLDAYGELFESQLVVLCNFMSNI